MSAQSDHPSSAQSLRAVFADPAIQDGGGQGSIAAEENAGTAHSGEAQDDESRDSPMKLQDMSGRFSSSATGAALQLLGGRRASRGTLGPRSLKDTPNHGDEGAPIVDEHSPMASYAMSRTASERSDLSEAFLYYNASSTTEDLIIREITIDR